MIIFSRVREAEAESAFVWFSEFAAANDAIYRREAPWFLARVEEGAVWSASEEGQILGLVYVYYDAADRVWELGGLMVSEQARKRGIGLALMRIALAHMLFEQNPFETPDTRIIAHVLKRNQAPRGVLEKMHFKEAKQIREPKEKLPGLTPDEDGFINGDEFQLQIPAGLQSLADWLVSWKGSLVGDEKGVVQIRREGVDTTVWAHAIDAMASRLR